MWYKTSMISIQRQIIDLIVKLPLLERRELVEHMYDTTLFGESVLDLLSADQRARLDESIAQAGQSDVIASDTVFRELAAKFGFTRA